MKKMTNWRLAAIAMMGSVLCGCYTKRVVWSSDGEVAAVHGGDGLYLADAEGEISERWSGGECVFDWVPGSRRLVVATVTEEATWEGLAGLLEEEVCHGVKGEAERLMVWLESGGTREDAKGLVGDLRMMGGAVELCLVGEFKERLADLAEPVDVGGAGVAVTRLVELSTEGLKVTGTRVVGEGIVGEVADVNCSPGGQAVAVTLTSDVDEASELLVVGLKNGGKQRPVSVERSDVALYPDWTPDGRSLVYERSVGGGGVNELGLGVLVKREVMGEGGAILISGESEELAGGLFGYYSKVRCLPDGGIIFTGLPARLPAVVRDMPQRHELFLLEPGRRATLVRVLPEESLAELPDNLAFFEMSPDGKRLVVPGDDGEVFIVEWEAGDVGVLRGEKMDHLRTVPVWRSAEELCYVGVIGDGEVEGEGKHEVHGVVLWRDHEERVISGKWGQKVREGLLD